MKKLISAISLILCTAVLIGCQYNSTDEETTSHDTTEPLEVSDTVAETLPNISGDPLTMTQVSTVLNEAFTQTAAYRDILTNGERFALTPGLKENTVPQGLARNPKTGYIYVSSYSGVSNTPSVILVLDPTGKFVAEYIIYNSDGTPFTGHVGGVAVTEDYLYFSGPADDKGNYTVAEFDLDTLTLSGSQIITIKNTVPLPISTSFLFYADGIFWAGNFYLKGTYDLGKLFNFTTRSSDGKEYGGYAAAFDISGNEEKRLMVDDNAPYVIPDHVLAIPDKVQGFAYSDGKVALSISYGRKNTSSLEFYEIDLEKSTDKITVDGEEYPMVILDSKKRTSNVTVMPMTEGLTLSEDGEILILFESAAMKYSNSLHPTDYIWKLEFPD